MPPNNLVFDGTSLQTANIVTQVVSRDNLPAKNTTSFSFSHSNRSAIPYVYYPNKTITATGRIIGSSAADLDARIDTFKLALSGSDKNLDIDYNGSVRRYVATLNACTIDRTRLVTYADFNITFFCTNPFGIDTAVTTAINTTGNTTIPYQPTYTFLGTAPTQRPKITVTLTDIGQSGANVLTNPSFEVDTSSWNTVVGTLTRVTTQNHAGVAAGQVVSAGIAVNGFYGQVYNNLTGLTVGTPYVVSVWVKSAVGGETVNFGQYGGNTALATATLTTGWQQLKYTFTPTSSTYGLMVGVTTPASTTWFLDDLSAQIFGSGTLQVSNNTTSQYVSVTRTWAIGDIFVIDTFNKSVQVNGIDVTFTGAFPEFKVGSGTFAYSDTYPSRTFNFKVEYQVGYL